MYLISSRTPICCFQSSSHTDVPLLGGLYCICLTYITPYRRVLISVSTGDMYIHSMCFSSSLFSILLQEMFSFYSLRMLHKPTFILGSRLQSHSKVCNLSCFCLTTSPCGQEFLAITSYTRKCFLNKSLSFIFRIYLNIEFSNQNVSLYGC